MMITRTTVSCFHRETEFIRPLQRTKMFTSKRTLIALGPRRLGSDRENSGCFFFPSLWLRRKRYRSLQKKNEFYYCLNALYKAVVSTLKGLFLMFRIWGFLMTLWRSKVLALTFDRCWLYSFKFDLDFQLSYVVYNIILWFGIDMQTWMEISNCPRWIG